MRVMHKCLFEHNERLHGQEIGWYHGIVAFVPLTLGKRRLFYCSKLKGVHQNEKRVTGNT